MYRLTPALRYRRTDRPVARQFQGGFFRILLRLAPLVTASYVLISLLQYVVPLLFIYTLTTLVEVPAEVVFEIQPVALLLALTVTTFALVLVQLNLERVLSLKFCQGFETLLNRQIHDRVDLSLLERIASRDFNLVLDGASAGINVVVIPVFLLLSTLAAFLGFGSSGVWAVSVIWLFLPLSWLMSRLSDGNYERIMAVTAQRIERCSAWLREGPLLKQFPDKGRLGAMEQTLARELSCRNLDTVLRGADSYIVGFGRLIPFVLLLALGGLVSGSIWEGAVFWLSIPLLAAILGLPRAYLSYRSVSRALHQLDFLDAHSDAWELPTARPADKTNIDFDRDWPLWPAALGELLPDRESFPEDELAELLRSFRLIPELGQNSREVLQRFVDIDGRNISEGQKLRLQLLRGVLLARTQNRRLHVDDDFSSLDGVAVHAVSHALRSLADVALSERAEQAIDQREISGNAVPGTSGQAGREEIAGSDFTLAKLLKLCWRGILLLVLPALMMSYGANLTLPGSSFSASQILLYVLVGIALGTFAGLFIERLLRRRFASLFLDGLRNIRESDLAGSQQVISRDVTTAFERISWYAHDIAWILALLACNVVALYVGFGWFGIAVMLLFGLVLMALYRLSIDELFRARRDSASGFDALMRSAHAAYTLSRDFGAAFADMRDWLDSSRRRAISLGLEHFYVTRMRSVVSRTMMAASCTLVSDAVIVLVVVMGGLYRSSDFGFTLAVTALLLVRSELSNVFLAVTGFRSQSLSISRLQHFARYSGRVTLTVEGGALHIAPFEAHRLYRACSLARGRVHSLSGPSGSGKSQYLKGVAGVGEVVSQEPALTAATSVNCYYLNSQVLSLIGVSDPASEGLLGWLTRLPADGLHLILLDELFGQLSEELLTEYLQRLEYYARLTGNTLVVVEHRRRLACNIELNELVH
jgi:hypothetical protein